MTIVDSCGWIEVFTEGPLSDRYWKLLKDLEQVVTPTIILYEVYKIIKRERTEEDALLAISLIKRTRVVPLTDTIALSAADAGLKHGLPMADAIVYATAMEHNCDVVTEDRHFEGLDHVIFVR